MFLWESRSCSAREGFCPDGRTFRDRRFCGELWTTFVAVADLIAILKGRSSVGMNPTMAAITGYASRPVMVWNVIAVLINSFNVGTENSALFLYRVSDPS